jgi:hypothetical protein
MRALFLTTVLVLLAGCASQKIFSEHDSGTDFGAYRSFAWIAPHPLLVPAAAVVHPQMETYLMASTRANLEARGYTFAPDPAAAQFLVGFAVGTPVGVDAAAYPADVAEKLIWRPASSSADGARWLKIDVYDASTRAPVWRGTVRRDITGRDQANAEAVVRRVVDDVLARFPPG